MDENGTSVPAKARCPSCGKFLSYKQLTFGAEHHAIICGGCGARLIKHTYLFPLLIVGGIAVFAFVRLARIDIGFYWHIGWLAALVGVGLLTTKVSIAGNDVPDAPLEDRRSSPPPVHTHFRGSSGPPPKPARQKEDSPEQGD